MKPNKTTLSQFNLHGEIEFLPGGEQRTYRVGNVVLKFINTDNANYLKWIADTYSQITENEFRVPKAIKTIKGEWLTDDGWSAWEFLSTIDSPYKKSDIIPNYSGLRDLNRAIKLV